MVPSSAISAGTSSRPLQKQDRPAPQSHAGFARDLNPLVYVDALVVVVKFIHPGCNLRRIVDIEILFFDGDDIIN